TPKRASMPVTYRAPSGATVVAASRGNESRRETSRGSVHVRPPSALELTTIPSYVQRSRRDHATYTRPSGAVATLGWSSQKSDVRFGARRVTLHLADGAARNDKG